LLLRLGDVVQFSDAIGLCVRITAVAFQAGLRVKLSHYTTERGLIGIVRSQSLRATDFLALNDQTEFTYATQALWEEALEQTLPKIPPDLRNTSKNLDYIRSLIPDSIRTLKKQVEESDGYGSFYVTSFARGRNDDEEERGILSLWHRYGDCEGYCLQFKIEDIRRIVNHERTCHSYAWIELAEVIYEVDRGSSHFKELVEQISLRLLKHLYFETNDLRFTRDLEKIRPDSSFMQELVSFCGKHKDPAFGDEREMRIFVCPMNATEGRIFTGLATPKTIYRPRHGARYVVFGEDALPGAIPKRIVIGPKGKLLPDWKLDALYPRLPVIEKSDIPIR
jgi:hypothetical protein